MASEIISALIGASVGIIVAGAAYIQWKRNFELMSRQLSEDVTTELISQRVAPYTEFMKNLRMFSSSHDTVTELSTEITNRLFDTLQDAVYGAVGLLASHETRQLILHARGGCVLYQRKAIDHSQLMLRLWGLHLSLRSDLGIHQPEWASAVERILHNSSTEDFTKWEELVRYYPWERLSVHSVDEIDHG